MRTTGRASVFSQYLGGVVVVVVVLVLIHVFDLTSSAAFMENEVRSTNLFVFPWTFRPYLHFLQHGIWWGRSPFGFFDCLFDLTAANSALKCFMVVCVCILSGAKDWMAIIYNIFFFLEYCWTSLGAYLAKNKLMHLQYWIIVRGVGINERKTEKE